MPKVIVKVLKLRGETGLRQPGTSYLEYEHRAVKLEKLGYVDIVKQDIAPKKLKIVRETKELKMKRTTKKRK